jgi:lipopolysaccharide export system permease protein
VKRLGRVETYVLVQALLGVATAFLVGAVITALINFVEQSRWLSGRADVGFSTAFTLALLESPGISLSLLPFSFLFGVLGAYVRLNRSGELIAIRAAGISAWRFILPTAVAAMVIGVLAVTLLNPVASVLTDRYEKMRAVLNVSVGLAEAGDTWLRQGDERTQVVIRARGRQSDHGTLVLKGVSLFMSTQRPDHSVQFARRIEADQARLEPGHWLLTGAWEATPGAEALRYDTLSIPTTLQSATALQRFAPPRTVAFWRLWSAIARTEQAGFSATAYRLELQELLATPLIYAAMSVLAAAFSLRLVRLGGLAGLAGAGVALGFVLFFFNQFCAALGQAGALPAIVAAWSPPILALLSGFTLLCYTEDG